VIFENVYIHHITYDDPDGNYKTTNLSKGIVNIETESSLSIINSKMFGCNGECKNYSVYVEDGIFLTVENSEFRNAAGGIYISSINTCTINKSIFQDHDMTLNKESKYDIPGALYGGGIYVNTTTNMDIYDSQFLNNAVMAEGIITIIITIILLLSIGVYLIHNNIQNYYIKGGAIFINDFAEESTFNFRNITFDTNFSYGAGKDISGKSYW